MRQAIYKGVIKDKRVVFEREIDLPEGTEVVVTPLEMTAGSPQAVLAAMDASPQVKPGDVEELLKRIEEGKRPIRFEDLLT